MKTVTIPAKITRELVKRMDELIEQGVYCSRSELVRDSVRRLVAGKKEAIVKEASERTEQEKQAQVHRMVR